MYSIHTEIFSYDLPKLDCNFISVSPVKSDPGNWRITFTGTEEDLDRAISELSFICDFPQDEKSESTRKKEIPFIVRYWLFEERDRIKYIKALG